MKTKFLIYSFVTMEAFLLILLSGCNKEEDNSITPLPVLTTFEVNEITATTATGGGFIFSDGGSTLTSRGVCWSTNQSPTIVDSKTASGDGTGSFVSNITNLTANTTYYARAYATNSKGTGYGNAVSFTTRINIITVDIPAGTFTMGSPTSEIFRRSDETQHIVTLSAFRMSKYEITNAQFATFLNAKNIGEDGEYAAGTYPTQTLIYASSGSYNWGLNYTSGQWVPVIGYENHPVINVTWYGASEFATYAGGRLPTEAEWEYACRANTTTSFNTGVCLTNEQANYDWTNPYSNCTNTNINPPNKTQIVGTYSANAYGLHDMHGNVCEWCSDWYGPYPTTQETNPMGPSLGTERVIRTGAWSASASQCRSAFRTYLVSPDFEPVIGFRIVLVP